ncbi:MAG: O-antigen ligase domain-containing protein [Cyanothece sp. SIO1E1]|nr:O-antigen ligase domain-containing protein [Cyanothece sp. SIO1E1]
MFSPAKRQYGVSTNQSPALDSRIASRTKQSWFVIWVWSLLIILCLLAGVGRVFAPVFLLGTLVVGLFLYFRTPVLYVGYTWWMFFLGALIRRIIDYQAGYVTFGRWGLPALLVACISLITLFRYLPAYFHKGGAPFIISFLGLAYAFSIGVAYDRLNARYLLGLLEWLGPLAFGFHLFVHWRSYPQISQVMQKTFVWGALVMGSYGIYQFCVVPPWDAFYMQQISALSFGSPTPFEIRVFGTQGSPQGFATVMMAGLILLLSNQGILKFAASGTGYLGFLLTQARSGWLGWCMAMITLFPSLSLKLQMRLVTTILVMSLLIIPLANMEPFSEVISERLDAFANIENIEDDQSFQDRNEGYNKLFGVAVKEVIGKGLGASPGASSLGGSDTSILPLLFGFGWFGAVPYLGGILFMLIQIFQDQSTRFDAFSSASRAIALGVFSQAGFNQIFTGEFAALLWSFIGISMAICKYYQSQRKSFTSVKNQASA